MCVADGRGAPFREPPEKRDQRMPEAQRWAGYQRTNILLGGFVPVATVPPDTRPEPFDDEAKRDPDE